MNIIYYCILRVASMLIFSTVVAQGQQQNADSLIAVPLKYVTKTMNTLEHFNGKLEKKTEKYLKTIEKQEQNLKNKLSKIDSTLTNNLFTKTITEFKTENEKKVKKITDRLKEYIPGLDTLGSALNFLKANPQTAALKQNIDAALEQFELLKTKLKKSEDIKDYIREQKLLLNEIAQKYGLKKELEKYNGSAAEYLSEVNEIKEAVNNTDKFERLLVKKLSQIPAFRDFVSNNGFLAGVFAVPSGNTVQTGVFQNRSSVNQVLQQRALSSSANPAQFIQSQATAAREQLNRLQNRFGGKSSGEIKDFEPSGTKRKKIWQKLDFGFNTQFDKRKNYFPATANISIQTGYRLNKKSVAGVALNYKMGMGEGWDKIRFTHEGLGIRTYLKWKIKTGWAVSGGYEWNHLSRFRTYRNLIINPSWQKSGMAGISKNFKAGRKFTGEMQMLYDILAARSGGTGQPLVFRIGYSLKK